MQRSRKSGKNVWEKDLRTAFLLIDSMCTSLVAYITLSLSSLPPYASFPVEMYNECSRPPRSPPQHSHQPLQHQRLPRHHSTSAEIQYQHLPRTGCAHARIVGRSEYESCSEATDARGRVYLAAQSLCPACQPQLRASSAGPTSGKTQRLRET